MRIRNKVNGILRTQRSVTGSDKANNSTFKMVLDKQCNDWLYYVTNNANKEQQHYLSFDGSSRVITVMVDGVLCDGGQQKWKVHPEPGDTFQGWSFFPRWNL